MDKDFLLKLIENPNSKKPYIEFKEYLNSINKPKEAIAIEFLIQTRFNAKNTDINKK